MPKLLIKCSDNWADEMDVDGFAIFEQSVWNEKKQKLQDWFKPREEREREKREEAEKKFKKTGNYSDQYYSRGELLDISIGTNEDIYYSSFENWLSAFSETKLTDQEATRLNKLFNLTEERNTYGFFLYPDEYIFEEDEN